MTLEKTFIIPMCLLPTEQSQVWVPPTRVQEPLLPLVSVDPLPAQLPSSLQLGGAGESWKQEPGQVESGKCSSGAEQGPTGSAHSEIVP